MSGRKNPFTRCPKPMPVLLQPRDRAILETVYQYGILSGEQIERLFGFGSPTRRKVRLRALFDHGFLDRKFLPTLQGSPKALYVLGKEGVEIISRSLGLDSEKVRQKVKRTRALKDLFLQHRLQVNAVRMAFSLAIDKDPRMRLKRWDPELEIPGVPIIPDAYCEYVFQDKPWSFFLELDRATESHRRLKAKAEAYLRFGLSGKYQKSFGLKFFRVLVVTESRARLENLKKLIEGLTDKMFWFATLVDITAKTTFSPIWQRPKRVGLYPLLDAAND